MTDPGLTPAAKVLWLVRSAHPQAGPTQLAAASGLTLATVRICLSKPEPSVSGPTVAIPTDLLAESLVRPRAKLLYGLLQTIHIDEFSYKTLGETVGLSAITVKELVQELTAAGWMEAAQANQLAPVRFRLTSPSARRREAALRRLEPFHFSSEAIMKEYLSVLIASDEYEDNARPGWLINPITDEHMELDRHYPGLAAFEYNGSQHFRTTEEYPSEPALRMRIARDLMKEALCARRGIPLIVITRADLNLKGIQQKLPATIPLRNLDGYEELIEALEKLSQGVAT